MDVVRALLSESWFGTAIGFLGLVLAAYFFLKSRKKARLAIQRDHVTVVGGPNASFPTELEIRFAGAIVSRVTSSTIVLWNHGDRTIRGSELVEADPLRIELPTNGQVLRHSIVRQTRSVNGWRILPIGSNTLSLSFDFLDPNDGVTIEVLHSRSGSELIVAGTIMGIPEGMADFGRAFWPMYRSRRPLPFPLNQLRLVSWIAVVFGSALVLGAIGWEHLPSWLTLDTSASKPLSTNQTRWIFGALGFTYAIVPCLMLWARRRRFPAALEPSVEDSDIVVRSDAGSA